MSTVGTTVKLIADQGRVTKSPRIPIAIAASGTSFTFTLLGRGVITRYLLECFDSSGDRTRTLSFVDENSKTIWTGAAHADNDSYSVPCDIEIDGKYTGTLTLSGAAGGTGGTDRLTLWMRPF